jgi:hypothetical protein
MEYCHHDYHYLVMAVFEDLAKINKVAVKKVMDGVFLDGFEPLVVEVYEELSKRAPENEGVIYCCPECGSFDLVSEEVAQSRGYQCSMP